MNLCPRISQDEITEFMRVSHSEADDSQRCRQIIAQLLFDKEQFKLECERLRKQGKD